MYEILKNTLPKSGELDPILTKFLYGNLDTVLSADRTHIINSYRLVGLVVKTSASRAEDPEFESLSRWDFLGVGTYQWLKIWYSSGYHARRLVL